MNFWSDSFEDGAQIPGEFAFAVVHPTDHVELSANKNPHLAWSDLPEGTQSLILVCHDPDVPSQGDNVNKEGVTVPSDLPRVDFYHWVLVDLDAGSDPISAGEFSEGVTAKGKTGPSGPRGTRQGINNYTNWFEGDESMAGNYHGYDGPCPPWNDEIIHHYHFTLYALDVDRCAVEGVFGGPEVLAAIEGHVLEQAKFVGTYTLNPSL